ncbi:MAG: radical SAM protein [Candidatus Aminicenantes bacterium]|nr:radical SAM protein [Candidatus Aminicenantes bacterium]
MPRSPYVKTLSIAAWSQPGGPGRRLRQLDLELTERCNFNCLHCTINRPADDTDAEASEMSLEKIVEILRQATALGVLTVRFTGGEPLLRPDFDDIYQAARGLGLRVSLFTNASLITIRKAELFSRVLPLEPVEVSIYGMTEATAAAATQTKGARQAVSRGLKLLEMYGVKFIPKFVLLPPNQAEFTEFRRWAGERPGALHTPAFVLPSDLRARRDSGAANARLAKLRLAPAQAAAFGAAESDEPQRELRAFCRAQCGPQGPGLFGCGAGTETACIDAYGQFQLCLRLRHPETTVALGKDGLAGALSSFVPKVRRRKAQDARYLERCAVCFLKPLCEQCPASSWIESGKLDAPVEYHCRITHAQAFTLGLLEKGEQAWKVKDWRRRLDGPAAGGRDVRSA